MDPTCSPGSGVAGQYWSVYENKWNVTNVPFQSRPRPYFRKLPYAIQLGMVKIGQTFSTSRSKMDLAVGRRNEEETDLRVRHLR
jgi:hypothetical protein